MTLPPALPGALQQKSCRNASWRDRKQFDHTIQRRKLQKPCGRSTDRKTLTSGHRLTSTFKQNCQRRRIKRPQRAGVYDEPCTPTASRRPGQSANGLWQACHKRGGHRVIQRDGQGQSSRHSVQDFLSPALDLLRCDREAINPSTPLVLISCANCVRYVSTSHTPNTFRS